MFEKLQANRPLSRKVEEFLRQFGITAFGPNNPFQDTLLLMAGITENVKPLGIGFLKPDFAQMYIKMESEEGTNIRRFFEFIKQYDNNALLETVRGNIHSVYMNCAICLEKIEPLFEKAFIERISKDNNLLEEYKEISKNYYNEYLKKLAEEESRAKEISPESLADKTKILFMGNTQNTPGEKDLKENREAIKLN